jgi:uncharacterized protein (UPF0335 family)
MNEGFEEVKTKVDQDMSTIRNDTNKLDRKVTKRVIELKKNPSKIL